MSRDQVVAVTRFEKETEGNWEVCFADFFRDVTQFNQAH